MTQFKNMSQEDVQRSFAALSTDIEMSRKQLNEMEIRKADKKEVLDFKQKTQLTLDQKIDKAEVHGLMSDFTKDQAQKGFSFRKELFEKISDIQQDIASSVSQFVQISEMNKLLDSKADTTFVSKLERQKASIEELDSTRKIIERVSRELEAKTGFRDLESHAAHTKGCIDDLSKELVLKVSIKDLCGLLDQKVNVNDMNETLRQIQNEVERCVRDEELKKTLNEQALVNEALCAENCVGRWIWKSGDLFNKNQVPWEVQAINTCPDNFLWDKGKSSIICVAPGLYQLIFGFYSKKEPMVRVILNGEPLMTIN